MKVVAAEIPIVFNQFTRSAYISKSFFNREYLMSRIPYSKGPPWSTFAGHSHTNQSLALLEEYKKSFDSISNSSLAAQEEKREKNPPTPPEVAKMWTIFF